MSIVNLYFYEYNLKGWSRIVLSLNIIKEESLKKKFPIKQYTIVDVPYYKDIFDNILYHENIIKTNTINVYYRINVSNSSLSNILYYEIQNWKFVV